MVGKMNSRWQSDNPVRSIGEYLPLRQRCTHAALTQRNTAPYVRGNTVILYMAQRHAYVPSGMRRAAYVYVDLCARVRVYACVSLARARTHRDPSAGATSQNGRRYAHALCMNACTYTPDPGWIYSRRNFATRGDERGMREEERKELCGEMRESTDVARPRGPPKGLSKGRIFSISVEECVLQVRDR